MKSQEKLVPAPQAVVRVLVAGKTGTASFQKSAASPIKALHEAGCGCNFSF